MSSPTELAELHNLIGGLRRCVTSLKSRYDDVPAVRRIVIDFERILGDVELLDLDAAELDLSHHIARRASEKISIPDTTYDTEFWRDVDDEGIGGYGR
ncbi:MAG: hypothetical protein K2Q25_12240 [Mycobacteriaceae bacterium]|nr:hypothetical protein [Mycobacteriaceae bacterium]